jgi:hypothetical protein
LLESVSAGSIVSAKADGPAWYDNNSKRVLDKEVLGLKIRMDYSTSMEVIKAEEW